MAFSRTTHSTPLNGCALAESAPTHDHMSRFPIEPLLPDILATLAHASRLVLEAPPGAGKTTQVPPALLAASWCTGRILMLEPRRIAARAAAGFMAEQRSEDVGGTVGYRIRFENRVSANTRIEVVTEGILTRMLQDDPTLDGISAVLFDEFHERHLHSDLALALCLDVQESLRPDLRLLVMSATLDGDKLARFLDCPRLTAEGRSFPVTIEHVNARPNESTELHMKRVIKLALEQHEGDLLCFLPGKAEIERTRDHVQAESWPVDVLALHGELNVQEQAAVLRPGERRRVVLATNVAESSLTIPSVRVVIDAGLAREPTFDPGSGMSRLETVSIAQSSATQRAGRAGRVAPGHCYRLWPESQRLEPGTRPELMRVELSGLALEIAAWGSNDLRFLDPPPAGNLAQARDLLMALGALDIDGRLNNHGRALLSLGTHPRLASAAAKAPKSLKSLTCDLIAILEARDPLRGEARFSDDLADRWFALLDFRQNRLDRNRADRHVLAQIEQSSKGWHRRLNCTPGDRDLDRYALGDVLAFAYPDRIARQDPDKPERYQMANGRGAKLRPSAQLYGEPWIVIAEIRYDEKDSLIQRAARLDDRFLKQHFADRFVEQTELRFLRESKAVEGQRVERFAGIVLGSRHVPTPKNAETSKLLVQGIRELGLDVLPWSESQREFCARVEFLRRAAPEQNLPACDDATLLNTLDDWLAPFLDVVTRVSQIDSAQLGEALRSRLDYTQKQLLDREAPREIEVPSGMTRRISYLEGEIPVLAVKLQELFGLADTPRVGMSRVPLLLHLLSPGQKPIQVTRDLKGFWDRTYAEVKKELKGRYPKHPWPDDPWTATATHRAKPRGT